MAFSSTSNSSQYHPTLQKDYAWWIIEGLSHLRTEASTHGFDEFFDPHPPQRLPNLIGNPTDKARRDRLALQREFDEKLGKFIGTLKAMAQN